MSTRTSHFTESLVSYEKEKDRVSKNLEAIGFRKSDISKMIDSELQFYITKLVNFEKNQYEQTQTIASMTKTIGDLENQVDTQRLTIASFEENIEVMTTENEYQQSKITQLEEKNEKLTEEAINLQYSKKPNNVAICVPQEEIGLIAAGALDDQKDELETEKPSKMSNKLMLCLKSCFRNRDFHGLKYSIICLVLALSLIVSLIVFIVLLSILYQKVDYLTFRIDNIRSA
ncbi:Oidioi.mRNA.OKI2018_I69.chr2.g4956.t1.cds [Oikopleura dioica]|uniref:Oidioi.mRNA.OKI2018_I69.chr2.g4956.t1.cds n=1 Tax=Oikopleura dioica TaxID=34765 RepID=A0ABN7T390_OIKDI|nr:Oidioi.mRNA.OKI2018_I69.chr2.g4956.t1.cds [Oikopleura dioica]